MMEEFILKILGLWVAMVIIVVYYCVECNRKSDN